MEIIVKVTQVKGGFDVDVEEERAIASTPRQAGIRAGELVRKLIEAEYIQTVNK